MWWNCWQIYIPLIFQARPIRKASISAEISSARTSLSTLTAEPRIKQHPISLYSATAVRAKNILKRRYLQAGSRQHSEHLIQYIAKRPRAERHGAHGLFTDADVPINLSKVAEEVANHDDNVWTHIISLRREDAARLGYDNAYAWRNLLCSQAETIAENMKIPLTDLRWYAAYHDESYHPHVHMVVYSAGKEPYFTKLGIRNIKAAFAKQIFRHDLLQVYVEQTNKRNELTQKSRDIPLDVKPRFTVDSP